MRGLCYAVMVLVHPSPERKGKGAANQYKVVQTDYLYLIMKHFYPAASGFQDNHTLSHRSTDEYKHDKSTCFVLQSQEILDWYYRQHSSPSSSSSWKHHMREYVWEESSWRISAKTYLCSTWRSKTLLGHFMLLFPLIPHLSVLGSCVFVF